MNRGTLFFIIMILIVSFIIFRFPGSENQVVFADPQPSSDIAEAVTLYYQNNITASLEKFRMLASNNPGDISVRLNMIRVLRETGKFDEAIIQLNSILQQNPDNLRLRLAALQTTYLAGRSTETVKIAQTGNLKGEELYWDGLALADLERDTEARQALTSYLDCQPYNPMAYFKLGQLYQKTGDFETARTFYRKALAQDPVFSLVYYPLAQTYIALEQYRTAYYLLCNATSESPWNKDLAKAYQKLVENHPEVLKQQQAEDEQPKTLVPPQVTPILEGREKIPLIHIGLAERIHRVFVKTGDTFLLVNPTGSKKFEGGPQMFLDIRQSNGSVKVYDRYGTLLIKSTLGLALSYSNPGATTVLFEVEYGHGRYWAGREDRSYRGRMDFLVKSAGLTIVNQINIEEYLYGVVPGEMEYKWPAEALEAQAIAARTYAFANKGQFKSRGFDIYATVVSQVYDGVEIENPATTTAVDATRGKILTYNTRPIDAFYTGNSGGYTASSLEIWGMDIPYLQAIPDKLLLPRTGPLAPEELAIWLTDPPQTYSSDPKYSNHSHYRWVLWAPHTALESRLKRSVRIGRIISITVTGRSPNGIVNKVLIKGTSGQYIAKGDAVRAKLGGLRSNLFIVEPKMGADGLPEYFIFTGAGWGHGVGMDQSGAAGMAAGGFTCEQILQHYYPGTDLGMIY